MIFSCTKKVINKLKKHKPVEDGKKEAGLSNWYIDLMNLERKDYFLFTNSKTLFSFFLYAGTRKELQNIELLFEEKLKELIVKEIGSDPVLIQKALSGVRPYRYMKTNSRSILGSMNDFKEQIRIQLWHKGPLIQTYDLINHLINEVPMSAIKYKSPADRMKIELEQME